MKKRRNGGEPLCFLNDASIKTLYSMLNIDDACGIDYQAFFNLMQQVAEDQVGQHENSVIPCSDLERGGGVASGGGVTSGGGVRVIS